MKLFIIFQFQTYHVKDIDYVEQLVRIAMKYSHKICKRISSHVLIVV